NENVRRFDVSMDNSLLMRMLDRVADLDEQFQTGGDWEGTPVAIVGDLNTLHQFHDKIGPPAVSCAGVEDVSDVGMVHQSQRLPLGLKACDHAFGVHSRLYDLECDTPADGLLLLRHEDDAASTLADLLQQLVPAHPVPELLPDGECLTPFRLDRRRGRL